MEQRSTFDITYAPTLLSRAILAALLLLVGIGMPVSASAQTLRGSSFTTSTNDHTIEWNDSWNASLQGDDDFSTMVMLEGQIMIYAVMFIHDPLAGLNAKAVYYSLSGVLTTSFDSTPTQTVEWAGDDGTFHGLHVIELSDIDFLLYLRVDPAKGSGTGPTMQLAAAPLRAFPASMDAMQAELLIDGEAVLAGADGEEIMARLDDSAAESPADAESAGDSSPAPAAARDDRGRIPTGMHESTESATGSEYVSTANGFTVSYGQPWQDMAETNNTVGEFSLADPESSRIVISFTGRATTETNREAYFQDIVARESRYQGYVNSVVTDDRLLIATWTTDTELSVLEYVFVDDDTLVTTMVTISSSNPDRYMDEIRDIQLDGEGILRDWDELWPAD